MPYPTLVHSGFDTLDFAMQGFLPFDVLNKLKIAKEEAIKNNAPTILYLGLNKILVQVLGNGRRGGYAFQLNTGQVGAIYAIKDSQSANDWNIFVNIGSAALLQYGYHEAKRIALSELIHFGAILGKESISRVDYCFDFLMNGFELNAEQLIAHSRSSKTAYTNEPNIDDKTKYAFRGRKLETLTVGKIPNLQIQIYDKRREVIQKQKPYWFNVWGTDANDPEQQVWRVEVRAGKRHLKDRWALNTFQDIEDSFGDVVCAALEKVRYIDDDQIFDTSNVTRAKLHPLWTEAQKHAKQTLFDYQSGLVAGTIKEQIRNQVIQECQKSISAYARRLAAALELSDQQVIKDLARITHDTIALEIENDNEKFLEKTNKTKQKMKFIEDEEFSMKRYQRHITRHTSR